MVAECLLSYSSFSMNLMLLSTTLSLKRASREAGWPSAILPFCAGVREAAEHVCRVQLVPLA